MSGRVAALASLVGRPRDGRLRLHASNSGCGWCVLCVWACRPSRRRVVAHRRHAAEALADVARRRRCRPLAPQYVRCPVGTLAVGQAASMASLLLAAGAPGHRRTLPHRCGWRGRCGLVDAVAWACLALPDCWWHSSRRPHPRPPLLAQPRHAAPAQRRRAGPGARPGGRLRVLGDVDQPAAACVSSCCHCRRLCSSRHHSQASGIVVAAEKMLKMRCPPPSLLAARLPPSSPHPCRPATLPSPPRRS